MASDEKRIGGCTREEWRSSLLDPASVYAPNDPIVGRYTASVDALLTAAFSPSSFQAGAEQMREAAAKWVDERPTFRCEDCGYEGRVIRRSACCGDECPKCGGVPVRIVLDGAAIRALPLPVAPEEGR
jgi:Zn finger protein HypA/HybF involved in hydrogenase expression